MGDHRIVRGSLTPMLRAQLLAKEYDLLSEEPPAGVYVFPVNALSEWCGAVFVRQRENPYSNGVYKFMLYFPEGYPFERPTCRFVTSVYHPAIDPISGEADIGAEWFSRLTPFQDCIVMHFLTEVKRLFMSPAKMDHPRNIEANAAMGTPTFEEKARVCAKRADFTASHPTPDFPAAMKFADIPDGAVKLVQRLLAERESQIAGLDGGEGAAAAAPSGEASPAPQGEEEKEGQVAGGGPVCALRALRAPRPNILSWFRKNYIQISGSFAGIGE
eukprot:TRINITY_DN35919_c0_g1_i1.p1 TRINITY_DN35919_c0_g1~~TRINITY_DN35919_c0_g1_i1.p1  ORF type:complete len:273 (+),score=66.13 TRINITY_DN35919_c0_g1_i1:175-993(+)